MEIEGQLNAAERRLITEAIVGAAKKPLVAVEVGTWLGGGSTLHILRALEQNGAGHLWGIEVDRSIYERMLASIRAAAPVEAKRFTPLFGFSQDVLKQWKREQPANTSVDFCFLDGGNNPREQIEEFELLDPLIPVGGQLMTHDAKVRKGRWLVPFISRLDNWESQLHDFCFLDGGNNPREQIEEFELLDPLIPVGGQLMTHDAKVRKGRWLVPFISRLDNWESQLHDVSENGLFYAKKIAAQPSPASLRAARRHLFRQTCQPAEIAATWLPASVCGFALRLLPKKFSRKLSDGAK